MREEKMKFHESLCIPGDITQKGYEKKKQRLLASYNISSSTEAQSRKSGEIFLRLQLIYGYVNRY